ncbi:MAG: EAL domain-containing protein [Silicimonas sp.]|nr:EAL domain-containing protein [Silicimonas sp.]
MKICDITRNIGDFTRDCILITKAEPWDAPDGPEIVWCNAAFTEMTGYALDDVKGKTPRILQGPDTPREPLDLIRSSLEKWKPVVTVVKNYTKAGDPFWAELSIVPVADAKGWFHYWVAVQRDVTRRVEQEQHLKARNVALAASEKALIDEKIQLSGIAAVAEHSQDFISVTTPDFRILWANPAFIERSGYRAAAVRGSLHWDFLNKRGAVYASREMAQKAILDGRFRDSEVLNVDRHGTEYWTDMRVSVQHDAQGRPERLVIVERDITEQRRQQMDLARSQREIALASIRDPLTGLLNRRGLEEALDRLATDAEGRGHGIGILHIDLDQFKQINDTLGHAAGDQVLVTVSERLQRQLGPDSFAARVGGDEFVVAIELRDPAQNLQLFSDRLIDDLRQPVRYENADCRFSASVGHVECRSAPFDFSEMLINADIALYAAKRSGRNTARPFDADLARAMRRKKSLADHLAQAIDNGELFPVYQAQFDARSGAILGAEALVRWNHPEKGIVGPQSFLDAVREMNLEAVVDRIVLEKALHERAVFEAHDIHVPRMSVNVSSRRLHSETFVEDLRDIEIGPGELCFELLESTFLDDTDEKVMHTLDCFRERGIDIEIDDFGTGHASISGLLRIRPDGLKVDQSMVRPALEDPAVRRLFGLVVDIGKALSIKVTAEGVETEEHGELARRLGCSALQGFHLCRPITAFDFIQKFGELKV